MDIQAKPTLASTPSQPREGVDIRFRGTGYELSERWSLAGWYIQFARLPAHSELQLESSLGSYYVKVITGSLATPARAAFAAPQQLSNTKVNTNRIETHAEPALLALFIKTPAAPEQITDMGQLAILGPNAAAFAWRSFHERFGQHTQAFAEADAYMSGGFHLLDRQGAEISYLNLWTAGQGVNLTTHNHGQAPHPTAPAFAEVHWVFYNGTGAGGMYSADTQQGPKTKRFPMQAGDEHGPFFAVDPSTGRPLLKPNGAVDYPWHGWEAGVNNRPGQSYDVVGAFETNPACVQL